MFHTRFDPSPINNRNKVYDRRDNVDRNSYVDSTRLIERFILEGNNLNSVRAKALNDGLYQDVEEILNTSEGVAVPVYETDPAILQPIIDSSREALKSRVAAKNNDVYDDKLSSNSDLPERSPDNTGSNAK